MVLSIHYSGVLKSTTLIPALVEEVRDVCTILEWRYQLCDVDEIRGILFTPPECETVVLSFLPNGELICLVRLKFGTGPANIISVKTQFAGAEVHKAIIKLLKHLKASYFDTFKLMDESSYWETGDEELLHQKFRQYDCMLKSVSTVLQDFKAEKGDTVDTLAERLEKFLRGRLGEG